MDLAGQVGDRLLGPVDHPDALMQLPQIVGRVFGGVGDGLAEPVSQSVQPLAERPPHVGLPLAEDLGHGLHAAAHFRLGAGDIGQSGFQCAGALVGSAFGRGHCRGPANPADKPEQNKDGQRKSRQHCLLNGDDRRADGQKDCVHEYTLPRFGVPTQWKFHGLFEWFPESQDMKLSGCRSGKSG